MTTNQTESLDELNRRYATTLLPLTVLYGLMTLAGVCGNLLVLVVFSWSREYRNNNFKIFVICLGFIDIVSCISLMPAEMVKARHYFSFSDGDACKAKCFFNTFGSCSAAFALLIICIDRFRKVCQPLNKQIGPSLAVKLCGCVLFMSTIIAWPSAVMCGIETVNKTNIHGGQTEVYLCTADEMYINSVLRVIYKSLLALFLTTVALAYIVMYALIGRKIIKHWGGRNIGGSIRFESSKDQSSERVEVEHVTEDSAAEEVFLGKTDSTHDNSASANEDGSMDKKRPKLKKTSSVLSNSSPVVKSGRGKSVTFRKDSGVSFRGRKFSRQTSIGSQRFPYKTLIWFILTLVFVITYAIYVVLSFLVPKISTLSESQFAVFNFFFRLYFLNNIINPIVYCCLDSRFRRSCISLAKAIKKRVCGCVKK